jgi:hypothetical protein
MRALQSPERPIYRRRGSPCEPPHETRDRGPHARRRPTGRAARRSGIEVAHAPHRSRGPLDRAHRLARRPCLELARRRAGDPAVRIRPGPPVRRRPAPRRRHRLRPRGNRRRAGGRAGDVRRHGAGVGTNRHDRDPRRVRRHAQASRLDHRDEGRDGRGGRRRRDDRRERRARPPAAVRAARRARRLRGAGLSRSVALPSRPRRGTAGIRAGARFRRTDARAGDLHEQSSRAGSRNSDPGACPRRRRTAGRGSGSHACRGPAGPGCGARRRGRPGRGFARRSCRRSRVVGGRRDGRLTSCDDAHDAVRAPRPDAPCRDARGAACRRSGVGRVAARAAAPGTGAATRLARAPHPAYSRARTHARPSRRSRPGRRRVRRQGPAPRSRRREPRGPP